MGIRLKKSEKLKRRKEAVLNAFLHSRQPQKFGMGRVGFGFTKSDSPFIRIGLFDCYALLGNRLLEGDLAVAKIKADILSVNGELLHRLKIG